MPRKGRELELLIKRLEKGLLPDGAIVKSPHHLKDKITGQPREVDATVSYKLGTNPILIAFECRDRNDVEDSTWIEQMKCKHDDLETNTIVAVSSEGFTKPAIKKAEHYGISTRTVETITKDDLKNWISPNFQMNQKQLIARITYIMIHHRVKENVTDKEQSIEYNKKQFTWNNKQKSIWEIMNFGLINNVDYSKIPEMDSGYEAEFSVDFDQLKINTILTYEGKRQPLKKIDFRVNLYYQLTPREMKRVVRYSDNNEIVYEGFEYEIMIQNRQEIISIFKDPKTGKGFISRNYADE